MGDFMNNISFEYPAAFLILLLFGLCFYFCKARVNSIFFPNSSLLKQAGRKNSFVLNIFKFLSVLFLVTALASPIKKDEIKIQNDKGYEISLILDASGSMREYNKFATVKNIVLNFIKNRKHDKIGLTIFADFAYVAVPLTYDKESLIRLLSKIDVGVAGVQRTALNEALFLSSRLFKDSKAKNKVAILLTDGIDNTNTIPLDVAIATAKKYGIKVYTIGVGSNRDINPQVLRKIAKETGAKFYQARSGQEIKDIYKEIDRLEKSKIKANKYVKKSYYFQYALGFGLLFLLLYILGYRR
jgi:Ca-activated chloride channel family protein